MIAQRVHILVMDRAVDMPTRRVNNFKSSQQHRTIVEVHGILDIIVYCGISRQSCVFLSAVTRISPRHKTGVLLYRVSIAHIRMKCIAYEISYILGK